MTAYWVTHTFAPHMHDFYAISLNCGGSGVFECSGKQYEALPGTCSLIAPDQIHTGRAANAQGWQYRNLYVRSPLMKDLITSLGCDEVEMHFIAPSVSDPVMVQRLISVFQSLDNRDSLLKQQSSIIEVAERLISTHAERRLETLNAGGERNAVSRAKSFLEATCDQNVSIHSLCEITGLSPYYLIRSFHRHVGLPPHKYQSAIRISRAQALLKSGTSIVDVANVMGFFDQSHFSRAFKASMGVTPGEYLSNMRK